MALKRLVTEEVANQNTYEKISRELDVLAPDDANRERLQRELDAVKDRMRA
jgi:lipid A disaccharide synthetase